MELRKVIVMRGIPGAGKSTFIKHNYPSAKICSADNFFMINGEYKYNPNKIGLAHVQCMKDFLYHISNKAHLIVVDNTNIKIADFTPYILVGNANDYSTEVVRLHISAGVAYNRNIHNISIGKINSMFFGMEPTPYYIKEKVIGQ